MEIHRQAVAEARPVLERTARDSATISYTDLTGVIHVVRLEPRSGTMALLLDEISSASDDEDKGMLSAVVVHKTGDYLPGEGFFKLARRLGRDTSDEFAFYVEELARVYAAYAR